MVEQEIRRRRPPGPDELVQHGRGDAEVDPEVHRIPSPDSDLQSIQISANPQRISDARRKRHSNGKER